MKIFYNSDQKIRWDTPVATDEVETKYKGRKTPVASYTETKANFKRGKPRRCIQTGKNRARSPQSLQTN